MHTRHHFSWVAFWLLPLPFALANSWQEPLLLAVDSLDAPCDKIVLLAQQPASEAASEEVVSRVLPDTAKKPKTRSRALGTHSVRQYRMQNHKLRPMRYRFHRPAPVFKGGRYSR